MMDINDHNHGRYEIMVVEDNEASLRLLTKILEKDGYLVRPASSSRFALQSMADRAPDLVLLDIKMPDIDGFEVCRRLKLDERTYDVPVIFVSGLEGVSDKIKGFEAGCVDYITKPFASQEVLARVQTHLRLRDLTARLELKVQERTAELSAANQKLQQEIEHRQQTEERVVQLSQFPEENPNPVLRVSAAGMVLYRNPAVCGLSGWNCEAGEPVPVGLTAMVEQVFAQGEMVRTELNLGERTFHVCATPLHGGSYANIYGLDVTERKNLENELRITLQKAEEGRQILETLMKYVPEGITIADADFNVRLVSRHGEELLGGVHNRKGLSEVARQWAVYDADGITPLPDENLPLAKAIRNGIVVNDQELVQMNADGVPITLRCNAAPIRNDEGDITGGIVVWRDIRERKKAEQELAKTKERLERVLNSITEGYYSLDSQWRFIEANPRAEEHFGLTRDQLLGQNIWELTHATPESPNYQNFLEVMEKQTPRNFEAHSAPIPDFWAEIYVYPRDGGLDVYFTDISDRKRAESALRESEEKFSTAFRLNPSAMVISKVEDGGYVEANSAFERIMGWSREEMVGSTSLERGIWPDVDERQRLLEQLASQGYLRDIETKFLTKDGTLKTVIYSAEMITLDNKPFMLSTWTDITERKQTEEALRESEERFRTILYSIGDAVITTDTECRVRQMNPIAESLTGWTEAAAQGKPLTEVFHIINEHTRAEVDNPAERVLREGEIVGLANHTMLIARDGTLWPIADSGSPIRSRDGRVTGVVLVFRDQTVERAAAAALAESEARFRLALRNAPISVAAQDRDLRYVWAYNQRTVRPEDIVGKLDQDIFTPNEAAYLTTVKRRVLENNVEAREQMWLERPNGRKFLDVCFEPLLDQGGQPIGVGTTAIDLTPTKIVEMELERAREAAEAANQAKSQFLANMSHEIRTPMNGVLGMTDLALMKSTNPQVKEYLGYVKESGLHLLDIINDILDLSRIESGKIKLNRDRFSLRDFLDITIEPLLSAFVAKDVNFSLEVDQMVPDCLIGDHGRVRQILVNLLGNALKFTEHGQVSMRVELNLQNKTCPPTGYGGDEQVISGTEAEDRVQLLFSIRDTGIGIPSTHLDRIFESFEQVHVAHHAKYEGTGLGLSISKNLVELMDGQIWVESREGVGSIFYFTLSLETAPAEDMVTSEASASAGLTGRPLNILVAEDTRVNQIFIESLLQDAGHRVVIAETGREVLEILAGGTFDLVLMDIRMPEMNGDEATRIIRQNPPLGVNSTVPIIALTAYALDTERERYMNSGFDAYLTKPVQIEKLNQVLAELR